MIERESLYINGQWRDPLGAQALDVVNPFTEEVIGRVPSSSIADAERAVTAARARNAGFERLVEARARDYYLGDRACPLAYEPSGEDFLSPCLAEADVMRRVLRQVEFAKWLKEFLPQIPTTATADWLPVTISPDPSDPKLAHLDGLNLSRAWMVEGILSALPADDPRRFALTSVAEAHRRAGLAAVTGEHYEGGHWIGSFAVYLTTQRGIQK